MPSPRARGATALRVAARRSTRMPRTYAANVVAVMGGLFAQVLPTRSGADVTVCAAAGIVFIAIGLNFVLRRETYPRKRQGLIGKRDSAEERAKLMAAGGAFVILIGVLWLIYVLASYRNAVAGRA